MLVVVAYDVSTETVAGRRRLRKVARICWSYGQRAQKSLFECNLQAKGLVVMRAKLLEAIDQRVDNLRIYFIDDIDAKKIEQYGQLRMWDFDGPLVV